MNITPNITPVILTYNEEPNLEATLASLTWASRVVVVDSGSSDRTVEIARSFPNVAWFVREFDSHSAQWSYGVHETSIDTRYILALDADMRPGPGFQDELAGFTEQTGHAGMVPFEYRIQGRPLLGSIYPAQVRVFAKEDVHIEQRGHTQVFRPVAPLYRFRSKLIHEDHKPFGRWLENQLKYASLEAERIRHEPTQGFRDRLRRSGVSPAIWGGYAYLRAGGPLKGPASLAYAQERMVFEALLSRLLAGPESASPSPSWTFSV
jgi:glycosyltransferase involved in cell wall biosynthesis